MAPLVPLAWIALLAAVVPASRPYEGLSAVPATGELQPDDSPAPGLDEPPEVDEGTGDPPTEAPPEPPTPSPTDSQTASEPAASEEPTSLDDIFGTAEQHDEVEAQPGETSGETSDVPAPTAAAPTQPAKGTALSRFARNLDMRFRVSSSVYYDVAKTERRKFGRNENRLEFYFAYTPNKHIQIVGDLEAVFFGIAQARELDDLATQQMLTPFHFESDAAYIALIDILPNLDIKIGRQTLVWGTADKFNPTNNINPDDLEDRPLFTEPIANQMVVVDYAPLSDKLWFQGVYVPLFYPALLPPSAATALKDPRSPVPFASESDEAKLGELQDLLEIQPGLVPEVTSQVKMPPQRFIDGQAALKVGTSLGGIDMSVSYYAGRHDIPTPENVESSTKDPGDGPTDVEECCFRSDVTLVYPRMQVVGLDFATQLPFLGNLGLWGEGALFFPQEKELFIEFPIPVDVTPDDGETNTVMSLQGTTIRSTPFVKATTGFDYTFGKHVYVQLQYLRGFIDEFGADHIGNYLVGGTDLIFFGRHLILRLFGVVDLPTGKGDHSSYVIFPSLMVTPPWGSVNLELGSFFLLGKQDTKFGQRATGSSIVFFKVSGTF